MVAKMIYDVLASFTCPRTITFKDWRLGFTHKALMVAIVSYVCWNLFSSQLFLVDSVPLGLVSIWPTSEYNGSLGVANYREARETFYEEYTSARKRDKTYRYCDNKKYTYYYDANYDYRDISCALWQEEQVPAKGESQMFFTTFVQENSVSYVTVDPDFDGKCDRDMFVKAGIDEELCPKHGEVSHSLGRCYCRNTRNMFVAAAENMTLNMEHKYMAMYGEGFLPRTIIRVEGSLENLHEFQPGETLAVPVHKILEFLGANLDEVYDPKVNPDDATLRLKGMQVTAKLQYYNYHQAPGFEKQKDGKPGETICILEFSQQDMWASMGNNPEYSVTTAHKGGFVDRYRYGIKVVIQASGIISTVDLMFMVNTVIQGLVLLNIAVVATQMIAFYALGDRSKMYKEQGNETASFEREAARFAVQSIVAGHVFHLLDEDKSGALDQQEVFEAIKRHIEGSGLTEEEMDTLASFVIHQAELDSEQWGENGQAGVIELAEWDNLFTSGHADFHSLSRMIKHLDKQEASFLLDRAKSFRQSLGRGYGSIGSKNV